MIDTHVFAYPDSELALADICPQHGIIVLCYSRLVQTCFTIGINHLLQRIPIGMTYISRLEQVMVSKETTQVGYQHHHVLGVWNIVC